MLKYAYMNVLFKPVAKIVARKMKHDDDKVKRKLPKIDGVNKYLGYNYINNDKKEYRKFNLYKPRVENENLPLIIDIHGGGWIYVDKDLNDEYCMYLASKNNNVLSFSYRLLTMTNLKGMMQDVFTFMHYAFKQKDKLGISFNDVMLVGDSAGAHLALLMLAINSNKSLQNVYNVEPLNFDIDFLTLEHPVTYINHILPEKHNPFNKLANKIMRDAFYKPLDEDGNIIKHYANLNDFIELAHFPPILIVSSEQDELKEYYYRLVKDFDKCGVKYETKIYQKMRHVFEVLDYSLPESKEFNDYSLKCFYKTVEKQKRGISYEEQNNINNCRSV